MKKRLLALMVILVLLTVGITCGGETADAAAQRYQVGYAIRDVNPYVYSDAIGIGVKDLGDLVNTETWVHDAEIANPETGKITNEKMIGVPLSGYANSAERPSGGMYDDNGDGFTGLGDGLHITCTTVTDERGNTLIYFTLDAISGYANVTSDAAKGVVAKLGATVMTENVFVNGSHTHEGADYGTLGTALSSEVSSATKAAKAEAEAKGETFNEAAFKESYVPSAKVRLWKAYYDYVVNTMVDAAVECYNNRTEAIMTKGTIDASESSGYQLNFIRNYNVQEYKAIIPNWYYSTTPSKVYQFGSNFGKSAKPELTKDLKRTVAHVSEADDAMHILQFTPTNGDQPIVLVNWRSHATMMSGTTGGGTGALIASDYIGSFRYEMQKAGYRVAFLQGAAGNTISSSSLGTPWSAQRPVEQYPDYAIYYGGQMLKDVALDCLENYMTDELTAGPIRSVRWNIDLEMQTDSEGLIAAAKSYQENGITSNPYKYTHTDGKVYIINSKHHARNVVGRSTANPETYGDMTVNAFMLGKSVAFVTAPTEICDRYSLTATLDDTTDNDWNDLVSPDSYGTPFVMGYTNGHNGYTPNKLSYSYNEGSSDFGVGSYEANTSRTAAGEGEKMITRLGEMLEIVENGYKEAYCEHCKKTVEWRPLHGQAMRLIYTLGSGHYYIYEDIPNPGRDNYLSIQGNVCLDMNGKTADFFGRTFNINGNNSDYDGKATLNLMDSVGTGSCNSHDSGNGVGGGCIATSNGAVINMYGGTLRMITGNEKVYVTKGGVVQLNGATMTMYGGTIDASQCTLAKDNGNHVSGDTDGCGAAVAVYANGKLYAYGGKIIGGHAEPEAGRADCVLVQGTKQNVILGGDVEIDELYFESKPAQTLVISGEFTGKVTLNYRPTITLADNLDVGDLINSGTFKTGSVICAVEGYYPVVSGAHIKLTTGVAEVIDGDKTAKYPTLQAAIDAAGGKLIRMKKNCAEEVVINEDTYLDLNGCDITRGVTVAKGKTLYCKDSATDDYTVVDNHYGKIYDAEGMIDGIPLESQLAEDGYMKVAEEDGAISFHRVNLQLTSMTLRAAEAGVYYNSSFATDEVAAQQVSQYGVALSVKGAPNAENLETDCRYSWFDGLKPGGVTGSSTLLKGVLKEKNSHRQNNINAEASVYGSAYVLLKDGTYLFGEPAVRTFREQVESADAMWNSLNQEQKATLWVLLELYFDVLMNWNIPNTMAVD